MGNHSWIWKKNIFLFDLDGTLYLGKRVLPGALSLLKRLEIAKKKIYFFTNNSSRSQPDYLKKLKGMGFRAEAEQVIMSTHTLIAYLKRRGWKKVYLLGTPAMRRMLRAVGISHETLRPQAVVVGFDKTITYKKLEEACRWVSQGIPYVVTHPDFFCPTDIGPEPDCGAFAKVIELTTKKNAVATLGKPHPAMVDEACKRSKGRRGEMVLIGDRLMTDIEMGKRAGIDTILVLTGETKRSDLRKSKLRPTAVLSSVAEL